MKTSSLSFGQTTFDAIPALLLLLILALGTPTNAAPPPGAALAAADDQVDPAVASDGDGSLVVWADRRNNSGEFDIYGARVSATGEVLDAEAIPICTAPDSQWYPAVAFDGVNYLVVWSDGRANGAPTPSLDLYGARVTPDGVVLDPDGFQITHDEVVYQPSVAFNGTDYLVAGYSWEHNGERGAVLLGVRVTPGGALLDTEELVLHQSNGGEYPAVVARLGEDWLVAWNGGGSGIAGTRVSRDGNVSPPQALVSQGETWIHGLAGAGGDCFLTSVANRPLAADTYVQDVFGTWIGLDGRARNTVLIAANTNQTVGSHLQPTTYSQYHPAPIFNGSELLVVWEAGAMYTNGGNLMFLSDIRGARVEADGTVSAVISLSAAPQEQSVPAVAASGQGFLAVWQDARTAPPEEYSPLGQFDIYGARLTAAGQVLDPDGFLLSGLMPPDGDGDGVPDDRDACVQTAPGESVDERGCSLAQLCPCTGEWENQGEYIDCVIQQAWAFYRTGLITAEERRERIRQAVESDCGRQPGVIEPMQLHLLPATLEECGRDGIQFVVSGEGSGNCVVETSTNLKDWTLMRDLTREEAGEVACPLSGSEPTRFYRVRLLTP